jgi:hypothetical protein
LSPKNISKVKLLSRGIRIPGGRPQYAPDPPGVGAGEYGDRSIARLSAHQEALVQIREDGGPTHILLAERDNHILDVLPLSHGLLALQEVRSDVNLEDIAERSFIIAPPEQIMFDSLPRSSRRKAPT